MIRESERITGLVLNCIAVTLAGLHVDPLAMRSKIVIDATGHASEICRIVVNKIGTKLRTETGRVIGEKPMWAEIGERGIIENTREVYPGLIVLVHQGWVPFSGACSCLVSKLLKSPSRFYHV
jgi:thiamine thiazole synthase